MARAKSGETARPKSKAAQADELARGIVQLRDLSAQIDDLSRDGFPYRDAARARTELSLRETIRRLFGEKSTEYQTHKHHKLKVGNKSEASLSTGLIKELIAGLEIQKAELLGIEPPPVEAPAPVTTPPQPTLTVVPAPAATVPVPPTETPAPPPQPVTAAPIQPAPAVPAKPHPLSQTIPPIPPATSPTPATRAPAHTDPVVIPPALRDVPIPRQTIPPTRIPSASPITTEPAAAPQPTVASSPTPPAPVTPAPEPQAALPQRPSIPIAAQPIPTAAPVPPPAASTIPPTGAPAPKIPLAEPIIVTAFVPTAQPPSSPIADVPPSSSTTQPMSSTAAQKKESETLDILRRVCARFHLVARQLRLRKEYRPTLEITDETDLQDLFYALLRLQFDEVGTDDWLPNYAQGAKRTGYLLDWDKTVVLVKLTRSGVGTKELAEQVAADVAHYSTRPHVSTLVCFVYDPDGRIGNPRGLEADLTTVSDSSMVEVIVAPK